MNKMVIYKGKGIGNSQHSTFFTSSPCTSYCIPLIVLMSVCYICV